MTPIKFHGYNTDFGAPKDWDAERNGKCVTLPVQRIDWVDMTTCASVYKLSWQERLRILMGWKVRLTVCGLQPPVILQVVNIDEVTSK